MNSEIASVLFLMDLLFKYLIDTVNAFLCVLASIPRTKKYLSWSAQKKKVREIHEVTDSEVHALLQLDVYMCIFVYAHLWV